MYKIKQSVFTGLSFGLTSGTITTLGLMIGLYSGTNSRLAVIGGIVTIAVADALSDGLGIHLSEESEGTNTTKEVWEATIATFLVKFFYASLYIIPIILLPLAVAVWLSVAVGFVVLGALSYSIARRQHSPAYKIIAEHLLIMLVVIVATHYIGLFVKRFFS